MFSTFFVTRPRRRDQGRTIRLLESSCFAAYRRPSAASVDTTAAGEAETDAFPEGELVDVVYIADSGSVGEPYAELAAEILDREVRLDKSVDEDPEAIRTTYADRVAEAEIIVI